MKSIMKVACTICAGLLFAVLSRTASAQSYSGGSCTSSAPVYSGGALTAVAWGDVWSLVPGEPALFKVTLTIDGVVYLTNWPGKGLGVTLPYSDPGYVFDFEPSITGLPSGDHVAVWTGVINPHTFGYSNVGDFSYTTYFTVP